MYLSRIVVGVVATALVASSNVAFAQSDASKKPLGKMTCEDFIGIEDSFKPKVLFLLVTYRQPAKPKSAGFTTLLLIADVGQERLVKGLHANQVYAEHVR